MEEGEAVSWPHLQLVPADVTAHVDWAAADGAAAVLKQLVQRRQHWLITCLHVEDQLHMHKRV